MYVGTSITTAPNWIILNFQFAINTDIQARIDYMKINMLTKNGGTKFAGSASLM